LIEIHIPFPFDSNS